MSTSPFKDAAQSAAFWSKVQITNDHNECWEWAGARTSNGYGNVRLHKVYEAAHRVAYRAAHGSIPAGMQVCHICDNPPCCNPRHLMLGNAASNFCDMLIKQRQGFHKNRAIGERNTNAKMTADGVREMRRKYRNGEANQYELADQYGVTQATVGYIVRNKTWRHV